MKVMFICGGLEPGRDGVGDYTRRLAIELIRRGHSIAAISLNDKSISEIFKGSQQSEDYVLPVLRLPAAWPMSRRFNHARQYVNDFNPDWISLQFVIFGFHPKGLPFRLSNQLKSLGAGRRWHIMFHELWLGMEMQSSKKHSLWGKVQRLLIKSLISTLKPEIIHTHTDLYKQHLAKLGFVSQHLPLFSNIPRIYDGGLKSGQAFNVRESINFILFGNIHPTAPVEDFVTEVLIFSKKHQVNISLSIIGRCGIDQKRWAEKWAATGMPVHIYGEQPVDEISKALASASMGISTTPSALIEKSGAVAAMLEHGLPVICVPFQWHPKIFKDLKLPPGVILYEKGNFESNLQMEINLPFSNHVSTVGHQLISHLEST